MPHPTPLEQFIPPAQRAAKALLDRTFAVLNAPKVKEKQESNWAPLVSLVGEKCAEDFMLMGNVENMILYKHRNTRRYLNVDRFTGQTFKFVEAMTLDEAAAGKAHYEPTPVQQAIAYALSN